MIEGRRVRNTSSVRRRSRELGDKVLEALSGRDERLTGRIRTLMIDLLIDSGLSRQAVALELGLAVTAVNARVAVRQRQRAADKRRAEVARAYMGTADD